MSKLMAWLRQPTTIAGIATLVGTAATTAAGYLTGDVKAAAAAGALTYAAVHLAMPDNTAAATEAGQIVAGLVASETAPAPAAPAVKQG